MLMYSNTPPTPSQEGKETSSKLKNSVELSVLCGEKNQRCTQRPYTLMGTSTHKS